MGEEWIKFLNDSKIRYYIRIRNNFKIFLPRKGKEIPVSWMFQGLKMGEIKHYNRIVKLKGEYCYISATLEKKEGKPELVIVICFNKNEQSFLQYKERWQLRSTSRIP